MKTKEEIKSIVGLLVIQATDDGGCGMLYLHGTKSKPATVVYSWGGGWEHVSIAFENRTPTWEEMCKVKDLFWNDNECVVQFHPAKSEYVNLHPYCLHLWKQIDCKFKTPPKEFV